jgi:hypothetical protein
VVGSENKKSDNSVTHRMLNLRKKNIMLPRVSDISSKEMKMYAELTQKEALEVRDKKPLR